MKMNKKTAFLRMSEIGCFLFAIAVIVLNVSLAFDHVVWGDEAFSINIIRDTDVYGVFQRIYYWDNHPPLYYYWLKLIYHCFGGSTAVCHMASLIPFVIGIILALFFVRKKFGAVPAMLYMAISGLSATSVEYNLEIRMYEVCFLFILVAFLAALQTLDSEKKRYFVVLTVATALAAYSHYFGLVVGGILLFFTGVFYFLKHRGKSWLRGVFSILGFFVLYGPWLYVFYMQTAKVSQTWWLSDLQPLGVLTTVIFCGETMCHVFMWSAVVLSLYLFLKESGMIYLTYDEQQKAVEWHLQRPKFRNCSKEVLGICLGWCVLISTVAFTYLVSLVINPLTIGRYMYPLVPISIMILVLCISRLLGEAKQLIDVNQEKSQENNSQENNLQDSKHISLVSAKIYQKMIFVVSYGICLVILLMGLWDFKYYRSVTKTQELFTQKTLETVGELASDTVLIGNGVKHLAWMVLQYYYPDNEVLDCIPIQVEGNPKEMWAFLGYEINEETQRIMTEKGYVWDDFGQMWVGKYECRLYHFYKEGK